MTHRACELEKDGSRLETATGSVPSRYLRLRQPIELMTLESAVSATRSKDVAEKHDAIGKRDKRSHPNAQFPIPLP